MWGGCKNNTLKGILLLYIFCTIEGKLVVYYYEANEGVDYSIWLIVH